MIERLNRDCFCVSVETDALRRALDAQSPGLSGLIEQRCPHLFAALPVFVSRRHVDAMAAVVAAVEEVVVLPGYREAALAHAPGIAQHDPGARGAFMGYDFHLGAEGPRLIEINTNAGGALLNAVLGQAQRACCAEVAALVNGAVPAEALERTLFDMFAAEWRHAGRTGLPGRLAIVDSTPEEQFLYPEFVLFERLFRRFGIDAVIRSPSELAFADGTLRDAAGPIDLVYNRLTDFYFEAPRHEVLRSAYERRIAVVTPHPHAHAVYANKHNLALLSDPATLARLGAAPATLEQLVRTVPSTRSVAGPAEPWWNSRKSWFFKPGNGFGSRGSYRGDKLTRRVFSDVMSGDYVAQRLTPPSERWRTTGNGREAFKVDVRCYAFDGRVQLMAARLYQGQTTNFRTAGGGFAPVYTVAEA